MKDPASTSETILCILRQHTAPDINIALDSPLFDDGIGLDSVGLLAVVVSVEAALGVSLGVEDLSKEVLSSVGAFIARIEELQENGTV